MMTAKTNISKPCVEIQGDQCGLDQDLIPQLPPVPDCNGKGINHHHEDIVVSRDNAEDNSYVFVSGNDDLVVVPIDNDPKGNATLVCDHSVAVKEDQNVKVLHSSASGVESSWVFEGTQVAPSSNNSSADKNDVTQGVITDDAAKQQNVRVGSLNTVHPEDNEKDPIYQKTHVGVLEFDAGSTNNVQPQISLDITSNSPADKSDVSQFAITGEAAQQNVRVGNLDTVYPQDHEKDQISSLQDEENQESQVWVLELNAGSANNVQPETSLDTVESINVNQESQEKNDFELTSSLGEGEDPQHANLEATCGCGKSSQVGILGSDVDSVGKPETQTTFDVVESIDVNKKSPKENLESVDESGESRESHSAGMEVTSSESSEVEISKGSDFHQNSESSEESTDTIHACPQSEVQEANIEDHSSTESTGIVPVSIPDQPESHYDDNHDNVGEKLEEEETKTLLSSDAKDNEETINVPSEDTIILVPISEQSETHHDDNLGNDGERLGEETKTQLSGDTKEVEEMIAVISENSIIPVPISEHSESHHLGNDGEKFEEETKTPLSLDAKENLGTITVLVETDAIPITIPELSESDLDDNLGNSGMKLEEETNPQPSSDAKENQILGGNGIVPVTISEQSESHHEDNLGNAGVKLEEDRKTQIPSDAKQNQETITLLGKNGKIPVTSAESSESHLDVSLANDGEKLEEETNTQLSSDAKEKQETIPVVGENGYLLVDLEHKFKKSVNEVEFPLGTETTCGPVLAEIECPVSSFNDSVPETKASFGHIDTIKRTAELQKSSKINDNLIPVSDTDIGQSPVGNNENIHLKPEVAIVDTKSADLQSLQSEEEIFFDVGSSSVIISPVNDVSDSSITKDKLPILVNLDTESRGGHLSGEHLIIDDKLTRQETKDVEISPGAVVGQDVSVEPLTRPFHFLIRMPRFEDFKMKEQMIKAQLLVEEKTQHRDAFRIEAQKYKANCLGYAADYDAANSESRTLKRSIKAKRAGIDSLQSVINKVKNAISIEDIDTRIHSMEHMIEHETLPLKEEKLLIREIKQLKQLREQLSSNIGSQDEVQQALNDRDQIEERLKVLKKELDSLKESVLKADSLVRALEKKYGDENKKVKEIQAQYSVANNVRQDAYAYLQSLRKQLYEKNQQFRMYKENAAAASNYAMKRDRDALHHLCINQVESVMELWNKNDEFRKDYVSCNMKSTLRRMGTLDGRSLGPDEQPPVLTSFAHGRVDRVISNPANSGHLLQTSKHLEQEVVKPGEGASAGDKATVNELEEKKLTRPQKQEKTVLENGLATVSGRERSDENREEQRALTAEELEVARKVEELKKAEAAAKLKEQCRLEEKAKALEALERKKRNAEKAQLRAELRTQKEAEQREKEREKRVRKKERKRTPGTEVPDSNSVSVAETTSSSESLSETTREGEIKENAAAANSKRSQKPSQFSRQSKAKSIPPPLRNRRRKLQQWMWIILTCLVVVALFLVGNLGLFSNLSSLRQRNYGF